MVSELATTLGRETTFPTALKDVKMGFVTNRLVTKVETEQWPVLDHEGK